MLMSAIARVHLVLIGFVVLLGAYVWGTWPTSAESEVNALASPYCIERGQAEASILATASYVKDMTTGDVVFEKNPDAQLPLASLTKVMTVLVAGDMLVPDDRVTVTAEALLPEGSSVGLNEVWKAADLMDYTLISSANDGAEALALAAAKKHGDTKEGFIARMNNKAATLGLTQTYFSNTTGLDLSESSSGAYGSARDAANLIAYAVAEHPELFEGTTSERTTFTALSGEVHEAKNTSGLIWNLAGAVASKTGFTDLAGGNLVIVFEPVLGRPIAASVMGSSREGRDEDMAQLAAAAKRWVTRDILCDGE